MNPLQQSPALYALVLQFHSADRDQAAALARLIADIEPAMRTDIEVVFCHRFDTEQEPVEVTAHVAKKFLISGFRTRTEWTGWPDGCNAMARDVLGYLGPISYGLDGIIMIEPDFVPLRRTWLNEIIAEWKIARAAGKWLMGSFRQSGPPCGHINGNCCLEPEQATRFAAAITSDYAWDCEISRLCGPTRWHQSGLFLNKFQSVLAAEADLLLPEIGDVPPCVVHGYKDDSAMAIARKWMNLK